MSARRPRSRRRSAAKAEPRRGVPAGAAAKPTIEPAGDSAFLVRCGDDIGEATHRRVLAAMARLDRERPSFFVDLVPGYRSVMVIFDPTATEPEVVEAEIARRLATFSDADLDAARTGGHVVEIPVLYDVEVAPDLEPLAREKSLAVAEVVARHGAPLYAVHAVGFRPGFPFLAGLDPRLATPRLATPRARVPAGSVGIGGAQTGIYPSEGPGGWRLIGRTPLRLFDPARPEPFLLAVGDHVRFAPIDRPRFEALAAAEARS